MTEALKQVFVVDDASPEDMAMLQALYSRSPASVVTHREKLAQAGSGKFMDQYYVGYGHASIGDCGTTTCFVEQVSMLVAKAIQDNPLYNGQEASTRYLDFAKQAIIDPYDHPASRKIQDRWNEIYRDVLPKLVAALEAKQPFDATEYKTERVWRNTVQARAFDIARSLLPLGTTTLLSWTTSLRQARDQVRRLKHHPLAEVREVADNLFAALKDRYPHSFKGDEMDRDAVTPRDVYAAHFAFENNYQAAESVVERFGLTNTDIARLRQGEVIVDNRTLDLEGLRRCESKTLAARMPGAPLPWRLESYGRYNFIFLLDFGSYRDIQRHRNGVCPLPLIDARFGMHPWYVAQFQDLLSEADADSLLDAIQEQLQAVAALASQGVEADSVRNQYLYPMGLQGLVVASYAVPQALYVGELRSQKTVHPSLRPVAQAFLRTLSLDFPGLPLAGDMAEESWTAKRGTQTIEGRLASTA